MKTMCVILGIQYVQAVSCKCQRIRYLSIYRTLRGPAGNLGLGMPISQDDYVSNRCEHNAHDIQETTVVGVLVRQKFNARIFYFSGGLRFTGTEGLRGRVLPKTAFCLSLTTTTGRHARTFEHERFASGRVEQGVHFGIGAQLCVTALRRRFLRRRLLPRPLAGAVVVVVCSFCRVVRAVQRLQTTGR